MQMKSIPVIREPISSHHHLPDARQTHTSVDGQLSSGVLQAELSDNPRRRTNPRQTRLFDSLCETVVF